MHVTRDIYNTRGLTEQLAKMETLRDFEMYQMFKGKKKKKGAKNK